MRRRDALLAGIAIISVVIYALACKPAWNPSGKSVAYVYGAGEISGVALYDLEKDAVTKVYSDPKITASAGQCLWTPDGKSIILVAPGPEESNSMNVLKLDPTGQAPAEAIATMAEIKGAQVLLPPIVAGNVLWCSYYGTDKDEGTFDLKVDLAARTMQKCFESTDSITILFENVKGKAFYAKVAHEDAGTVEIGTFDASSGERRDLAVAANLTDRGWPYITADPAGQQFAMGPEMESSGSKANIELFDASGKVAKTFALPAPVKKTGYITWIDSTIWLSAEEDKGENPGAQARYDTGLLAIDAATGSSRFIVVTSSNDEGPSLMMLEPSLSPDGKRLAVLAAEEKGTSLVLIDPANLEAAPKVIPLPESMAAKPEVESTGEIESTGEGGDVESTAATGGRTL